MTPLRELRAFLDRAAKYYPTADVAIDDGGLTLIVVDPDQPTGEPLAQWEVGGVPAQEEQPK